MNTMRQAKRRIMAVAVPLGRSLLDKFGSARARIAHPGSDSERAAIDAFQSKWGLGVKQMARIKMIAELRNQSIEVAFRKTISNFIMSIPAKVVERNVLRDLEFESVGIENGLTKLVLSNGRTFYGFPSRVKHISLYFTFADIVPRGVKAETYAACLDAVVRYQRGGQYKYFPGPGGVVIEGGAYIGYKAVRMAEIVGPGGKVVAIEIGRRNFEVLRMNVQVNGLSEVIVPLHCGIWKERGTMEAHFEYANAYHLATPDEHDFCTATETVPTDTLDGIMDAQNLDVVDFLNLQLNGAEFEALEGLNKRFKDVKVLRVAAYYTRNGVRQVDPIVALLKERGCKILMVGGMGSVIAATPRFANDYEPPTRSSAGS